MSARAAAPERVVMVYPSEGEEVDAPRFRFLIEAPERPVEIAIDGGGWRSCRRSDGLWWFEQGGLQPGRHQALIRCRGTAGRAEARRACRFRVRAAAWKSAPFG